MVWLSDPSSFKIQPSISIADPEVLNSSTYSPIPSATAAGFAIHSVIIISPGLAAYEKLVLLQIIATANNRNVIFFITIKIYVKRRFMKCELNKLKRIID
jgi:hypothetical protein